MSKVKDILKKIILKKFSNIKVKNYVIQNINRDYTRIQKNVLISYITSNYNISSNNNQIFHTNISECQQIVNQFAQRGYNIDICDCLDNEALEIVKSKKYDVIFGLGKNFYEVCKNNPDAIKIIYATENPPSISKVREKERIDYFYKRHGIKISFNRTGVFYKSEYFDNVNYCITVGEDSFYADKKFTTFRVFPTGFINANFFLQPSIKKHNDFLWFGSNGTVHKGLDILIDIFSKRNDINLYICGANDEELKMINFNNNRNNIINIGRINVNSSQFIELANKCDYVILPSCSEGISTGVLTCMNHGMIPIVQKDTGFNSMSDIAYILGKYNIDYVEKVINNIISQDYEKVYEKRKYIQKYSKNKFNIYEFTKRFGIILDNILE